MITRKTFFRRLLFRVSSAILGVAVTQEGYENYIKGQHKVSMLMYGVSLLLS